MTTAPALWETRATAGADPAFKSGLRPWPRHFRGVPEEGPGCAALLPLSVSPPPPRDLFFFFPFPSSPRSPVVFPGRLCLAGDPFSQALCGRPARTPESRPCSPLRRPRPRLPEPHEAAAPGARAAGRERCLGRHLRAREPGRANRGPSGSAWRSPPCGTERPRYHPRRTRRKCSREGDVCFPGMRVRAGVGSTFLGNA